MSHSNNREDIIKRLQKKKSQGKQVLLTLIMIVRNESKNMPRLLNSLKDIIDRGYILDTGSEDNTIDIINNWSRDNNIEITIGQESFINFAHNRTRSYQLAKQKYPDTSYFLLSDADFVWNINGTFNKNKLSADKISVKQIDNMLSYYNIRLISNSVQWECRYVTHEAWCPHPNNIRSITGGITNELFIDDRNDGGCKTDKYPRDEKLLLQGLSTPNIKADAKSRYLFYLAQTYRHWGKYSEAIERYHQRINCKGWDQEIFYSYYSIGKCYYYMYKNDGDLENCTLAEIFLLRAHSYTKTRSESLYLLAKMFIELKDYNRAYEIILTGIVISHATALFVEYEPYDYGFDYLLAKIAPLLGRRQEGEKAYLRLANKDYPDEMKDQLFNIYGLIIK